MSTLNPMPWLLVGCALLLAPWRPCDAQPGRKKEPPPALEEIDRRASGVRKEKDAAKKRAGMEAVLAAYEARLALRPKDRKLVPRIRRKRAGLLKACGESKRALREYERIASGPSRRKDRARAWREAGELAMRIERTDVARTFLRRVLDDYRDVVAERAKTLLALGSLHASANEAHEAVRCWKDVIERCRDETKAVIEGYDRLALHAIRAGDSKTARRWLERCTKRFEKQAARDNSRGRFIAGRLGAMKAPMALAGGKIR